VVDIAPAIAGIAYVREFMKYIGGLRRDADTLGRVTDAMAKVGEVQDKLQELREENMRLLEDNRKLTEQVRDVEEWRTRRAAYSLITTPGGGVVLSTSKPTPHYACPSCAEGKTIQPLQANIFDNGTYTCPKCSACFTVDAGARSLL